MYITKGHILGPQRGGQQVSNVWNPSPQQTPGTKPLSSITTKNHKKGRLGAKPPKDEHFLISDKQF